MTDIQKFASSLELSASDIKEVECPVTNHFADGQYTRETLLPTGALVIGKIHKHSTINIMLKGKMSVYDTATGNIEYIEGYKVWVSEPNNRKIAYIHEEAIVLNNHPTNETDLDKIEEEFIVKEEQLCLG